MRALAWDPARLAGGPVRSSRRGPPPGATRWTVGPASRWQIGAASRCIARQPQNIKIAERPTFANSVNEKQSIFDSATRNKLVFPIEKYNYARCYTFQAWPSFYLREKSVLNIVWRRENKLKMITEPSLAIGDQTRISVMSFIVVYAIFEHVSSSIYIHCEKKFRVNEKKLNSSPQTSFIDVRFTYLTRHPLI